MLTAYKMATNSIAYFLLRFLKNENYLEEVVYEVEVFLNSLKNSPVEEVDYFFKSLVKEVKEGGYSFTEDDLRRSLSTIDCPSIIKECIIRNLIEG